jgi:hypothetical protein
MIQAIVARMIVLVGFLAAGSCLGALSTSTDLAGASLAATASTSPVTKKQATAFAHAVNLTAADLPGFKLSTSAGANPESAAEKRLEHQLLHCVHPASTKGLVEVSSAEFERETESSHESVQSQVTVAPSAGLASRELAVIRSGHSRSCVSHYLDLYFKGKQYSGAKVSPVVVTPGTVAAPGTSGGFAWRISIAVTAHAVKVPTYVDILGFIDGPAEVSLITVSLPQPFPDASEQRLFSTLLRRAKAHQA